MTPREIAFSVLLKCENDASYSNIGIDSAITANGLSGRDRAFFTRLVYGMTEKKITLDYIIERCSSRKISDMDTDVLTALRTGVYQLFFMDSVADHAAVNESVKLISKRKKSAVSFVNAVLRKASGLKDGMVYPDKNADPAAYFSVYYSYPQWLCEMWIKDYGIEKCEKILIAQNVERYPDLRVNTLKTDRDSVVSFLEEKGISCEEGRLTPFSVRLKEPVPVSELSCVLTGDAFVQDEASQFCSSVLGAEEGMRVIDVCSCPGGKSFSLALCMKNRGEVFSFDLHGSKLSLVKKGAALLGLTVIETAERDGGDPDPILFSTADRVLVDAPCSGLGVIAKKPDIRQKTKESVGRLPEIQYRILSASSSYLKKGGRMVYSTCTLNKRENEEVAEKFLKERPDFSPVDFETPYGKKSQNGMMTLYPDTDFTDGFFISLFEKTR